MEKFVLKKDQTSKPRSNSFEEGFKRKRSIIDNGEENLILKKCNLTARSPEKDEIDNVKGGGMEEILKCLDILKDMQEELKEIKQTNFQIKNYYEELYTTHYYEFLHYKKETEKEIEQNKKKHCKTKRKIEDNGRKIRKGRKKKKKTQYFCVRKNESKISTPHSFS